jgi:hypothetical protein
VRISTDRLVFYLTFIAEVKQHFFWYKLRLNFYDVQSTSCSSVAEEEAERYRAGAQLLEARPDMVAAADILEVAAQPETLPDAIRFHLFYIFILMI